MFDAPQPLHEMDAVFMKKAMQEAEKAYDIGEVPVGAVIVLGDKIIGRGHNQVELLKDATAHAEILAMSQASIALENWRLKDAVLYTTLEPCMMCLGAMYLSRISRLVYAAKDLRHGALGSFIDLSKMDHPTHSVSVERGPFQEESSELMRRFFKEQRAKKRECANDEN